MNVDQYTRAGVAFFTVQVQGGLLAEVMRDGRIGLACKLAEVQPMLETHARLLAEELGGQVVPYTRAMEEARRGCAAGAIEHAIRAMEARRHHV